MKHNLVSNNNVRKEGEKEKAQWSQIFKMDQFFLQTEGIHLEPSLVTMW